MPAIRNSLLALALGVATLGSKCVSINDPGVFSVNVKDVTGTFNISTGTLLFGNPPGSNSCATRQASDYIDKNFDVIKGARLVDVIVNTNGQFPGNVNNGLMTINGTPLVRYSGSWNVFNTPQSLLTTALMTRDPAGVSALINAIVGQQAVTVCGSGAFTQPSVAGMSVTVKVYAQVDVQP
jgi:hypothetical protein